MNKHPTALMWSLIGLFLVVMGLTQLHKVWKHVLLAAIVIGVIMGGLSISTCWHSLSGKP